jgi:hypothetical protein
MDKDQEIQDIVNQLGRLQIQQSNLLKRLGQLNESEDNNTTPPSITTARAFAVGDRVRIKNPGLLQPARGTIIKIGRTRTTVEARNGTKIVRAPKNLILEN